MPPLKLTTQQQKVVATLAGLAIIILGIYGGLMVWMGQQLTSSSAQIKASSQQLEILKTATLLEPHLQEQHRALIASMQDWREKLLNYSSTATVIEQISEYASQSGVKILSILPQTDMISSPPASPGAADPKLPKLPYRLIPIQVEAQGGYHQVGQFVDLLEATPVPMQIVSVRLMSGAKDVPRHRVQLLVRACIGLPQEQEAGKPGTS